MQLFYHPSTSRDRPRAFEDVLREKTTSREGLKSCVSSEAVRARAHASQEGKLT